MKHNVKVDFDFHVTGVEEIEANTTDEALDIARSHFEKDTKNLVVEILEQTSEEVHGIGDVRQSDGVYDTTGSEIDEGSETSSEGGTQSEA